MMAMKRLRILLLVLAIIFLFIQTAQAADYASLKNDYIKNHPGQAILPFPWEPITSTRVLPFNYEIPAAPGNSISVTACRDQFESASFIVNAQKDLAGISISVPDLYDAQGNSIPADAINVRTVKVWYQAHDDSISTDPPDDIGFYLTPELLLKDDTLVKVDYTKRINYLKVTINGIEQYIDISNPNAKFPSNAQIHDTISLQPFSLKANENKQIWLTVHVPSNTPAGDYAGDIILTTPSENPVKMTLTVTVLPFELEPSPLEYSIYYGSVLPSDPSEDKQLGTYTYIKTSEQLYTELKNIKEHGVLYPTLDQWYLPDTRYYQNIITQFSLRNQAGLPNDHIYSRAFETNDKDIKNKATQLKQITSQYGYDDVYIYGIDEARGNVLLSERPAWQTVHATGAKVFVAVDNNNDAVNVVGDLLDVANYYGPYNTEQVEKWHSQGKRIFSYGNPQVGIENPEIYRTNYGFALWNAGYDGAMNWEYQGSFNHIWNDYDSASTNYRDHVFAYPTSDGIIDTIQWEGWRTAVDDTRYLASLMNKEGSETSARAIVTDALSNGEDMATIRNSVINQILSSQTPPRTPTPASNNQFMIEIYQKIVWYLDFWGAKFEKMRFW